MAALLGSLARQGAEQSHTPTAELSVEEWTRIVDTDLTGVFLCMKHEIPLLQAGGGGAIVNTSSGAGVIDIAEHAGYAAAKWGVTGLTKSAALEYAADGIRINAICPGIIDTPMMGRVTGGTDHGRHAMIAQEPIGRMGRPKRLPPRCSGSAQISAASPSATPSSSRRPDRRQLTPCPVGRSSSGDFVIL